MRVLFNKCFYDTLGEYISKDLNLKPAQSQLHFIFSKRWLPFWSNKSPKGSPFNEPQMVEDIAHYMSMWDKFITELYLVKPSSIIVTHLTLTILIL